jgi:hypothetical protein
LLIKPCHSTLSLCGRERGKIKNRCRPLIVLNDFFDYANRFYATTLAQVFYGFDKLFVGGFSGVCFDRLKAVTEADLFGRKNVNP